MLGSGEKKRVEAKDRHQRGNKGVEKRKTQMTERGKTRISDREGENVIRLYLGQFSKFVT